MYISFVWLLMKLNFTVLVPTAYNYEMITIQQEVKSFTTIYDAQS